MAIIIDIVGSMILSGMVLLLGLRMNMNIADSQHSYKMDVIVQENLVSLVQDLEHDFRKMGYRVTDPTKVVLRADSSYISFCGDMNDDGIIDTVDWYLGPPVTFTPNPNDKYLYRKVVPPPAGGNSISGSLPGVTRFSMRYLNQDGEPPVTLGQIWIVETTMRMESAWKVSDRIIMDNNPENWGYSASFWRQTRLASRNLRRHG